MKRRTFIKTTAALGVVSLSSSLFAAKEPLNRSAQAYEIHFRFDLSAHVDKECALWVPIPSDIAGFQSVLSFVTTSDALTSLDTSENHYKARTLYAKWDKNAPSKTLEITMRVLLRDRECDFKPKRIAPELLQDAERFLAASAHIPIDGTVALTAKKIVGDEKNPLKKAKKIYDWIVANSYRDEDVKGCGIGDPNSMLAMLEEESRMRGKCLDMSALGVALMRASGIPAREVFGIRVGASRLSAAFSAAEDITKAQHCKMEFFIDKLGWIPCDPADITKMVLKEKLDKNAARVSIMAEKFFGYWENSWMALNHARDNLLYPANTQGVLDQFGYPYGEVEGEYLDPFAPASYRYSLSSKKITS
ncbi:MAG: transglutaminase family protein [Sulfurimonas sp.]|nr:transglutaminase family protein [Sulfurimonas sp.]